MSEQNEVIDGETGEITLVSQQEGALAAIVRSEVDAQLSAAHKFPRSIGKALSTATTLATHNPKIAESCGYVLARSGKPIVGASVRLAEIIASSWGNLRVSAQIIEDTGTELVARGVCWDLETNLQNVAEVRVSVMTSAKYGPQKRFSADMISVWANAACSKARRNAILMTVPRSIVEDVYAAAMDVAKGKGMSMEQRREGAVKAFSALGATKADILRKLGRASVDDLTDDDLDILVAIRSMIKAGEMTIAQAFAVEAVAEPVSAASVVAETAAKRGRPVGSVNKPKEAAPVAVSAAQPTADPPAPVTQPAEAPVAVQAPASWTDFSDACDALMAADPTADVLSWALDFSEEAFRALSYKDRADKIAKVQTAKA